jgi:flagellar basal-body rod protein FlgC
VSTTRSPDGGPYKRRDVVLESAALGHELSGHEAGGFSDAVRGVQVANIVEDTSAPRLEHDPGHPDADARGYVAYPNVNVVEEMVDMITASRAYEAGISALGTAVDMAQRALGIGR